MRLISLLTALVVGCLGLSAQQGDNPLKTTAMTRAFLGQSDAGSALAQITNRVEWVTWYGAATNGWPDSSGAFIAASTVAGSNGVVIVPPGTYQLSNATFTVNTRFIGMGGVSIVRATNTVHPAVNATASKATFENIVFNGNRANATSTWTNASPTDEAILAIFPSSASVYLKDCTFTNSTLCAISVAGSLDVFHCNFSDMGNASSNNATYTIFGEPYDLTNLCRVSVLYSRFSASNTNRANRWTNSAGIFLSEQHSGNGARFDQVDVHYCQFLGVGMYVNQFYAGPVDVYNGANNVDIGDNLMQAFAGPGITVQRSGKYRIHHNRIVDGYDPQDGHSAGIEVASRAREGTSIFTGTREGENHFDGTIDHNEISDVVYRGIWAVGDNIGMTGNQIDGVADSTDLISEAIALDGSMGAVNANTLRNIGRYGIHFNRDRTVTGNVTNNSAVIYSVTGITNWVKGDRIESKDNILPPITVITAVDYTNSLLYLNGVATGTQTGETLYGISVGCVANGNQISGTNITGGNCISLDALSRRYRLVGNVMTFTNAFSQYGIDVSGNWNDIDSSTFEGTTAGIRVFGNYNVATHTRGFGLDQTNGFVITVAASAVSNYVDSVEADWCAGGVLLRTNSAGTFLNHIQSRNNYVGPVSVDPVGVTYAQVDTVTRPFRVIVNGTNAFTIATDLSTTLSDGDIAVADVGTLNVTNTSTLSGAVTAASIVATNTSTFQGAVNIATANLAAANDGTLSVTNGSTLSGAVTMASFVSTNASSVLATGTSAFSLGNGNTSAEISFAGGRGFIGYNGSSTVLQGVSGHSPIIQLGTTNSLEFDASDGHAKFDVGIDMRRTTAGSSTLNFGETFYLINANNATVTLPASVDGRIYVIKNITPAVTTTINTTSSQLIDGATSVSMTSSNQITRVVGDGSNWWTW